MTTHTGIDTRSALDALGVTENTLTQEQRTALDEQGYFIVENVLSPEQCRIIGAEIDRIVDEEQERAGAEVSVEQGSTRISNVFNKSTVFDCLLEIKPLLAAAHHMLGDFKVHGANMREPHQGHGQQPVHSDAHKMADGNYSLINSLITFDEMTLENGPTRIIPGSHKWAAFNVPGENALDRHEKKGEEPHQWARPGDNIYEHIAVDPTVEVAEQAPEDPFAPYPGQLLVTVPAGTVVVVNAHMWHSGTEKFTDARRRQFHLTYTRRDMPQQLIQREYLTPELYERMSQAHRYFLDIE